MPPHSKYCVTQHLKHPLMLFSVLRCWSDSLWTRKICDTKDPFYSFSILSNIHLNVARVIQMCVMILKFRLFTCKMKIDNFAEIVIGTIIKKVVLDRNTYQCQASVWNMSSLEHPVYLKPQIKPLGYVSSHCSPALNPYICFKRDGLKDGVQSE